AARSRQVDALPRLLCAPVMGRRDEEALYVRRAQVLQTEGVGRRQRGAGLGHAGADRGAVRTTCGGSQERSRDVPELGAAVATRLQKNSLRARGESLNLDIQRAVE